MEGSIGGRSAKGWARREGGVSTGGTVSRSRGNLLEVACRSMNWRVCRTLGRVWCQGGRLNKRSLRWRRQLGGRPRPRRRRTLRNQGKRVRVSMKCITRNAGREGVGERKCKVGHLCSVTGRQRMKHPCLAGHRDRGPSLIGHQRRGAPRLGVMGGLPLRSEGWEGKEATAGGRHGESSVSSSRAVWKLRDPWRREDAIRVGSVARG